MASTTTAAQPRTRTGPIERVAGNNFAFAEEFLEKASTLVVPENQSQRQAFKQLMPHLYVLRDRGCSFQQLTGLLNQCGFKLQPSTVRRYYDEMLADRMEVCKNQMKVQMEALAAVKRENQGLDMQAVATMLDRTAAQRREDVNTRLASMLGVDHRMPPPAPTTAPLPQGPAVPAAPLPPASVASRTATPPPPRPPRAAPKAAEPSQSGEEPTIPVLKPQAAAAPVAAAPLEPAPTARRLKCAPLKAGFPALKPRPKVAPEVYQAGDLEHPAISGLVLNLDQRLYGAFLEIIDEEDGTIRMETIHEKQFRILWKQPIPMTPSRTASDFTKMNLGLFPEKPRK